MSSQDDILPIHILTKQPRTFTLFKRRRTFFAIFIFSSFALLGLLWTHPPRLQFAPFPPSQVIEEVKEPDPDLGETAPLTPLGLEADQAYQLDFVVPSRYQSFLHSFIESSFPSHLKSRLKKQLDLYFSTDSQESLPERPKVIWQTNDVYPVNKITASWKNRNPDYEVRFLHDDDAEEWVRKTFKDSDIEWTWDHLPHIVMKADFLRYLLLLVEGGIYSDIDTTCIRSISSWGQDPDFKGDVREDEPAVIVGVEADVGNRKDWHMWWSRPLQFVQWTLVSKPGHPILLDTIRRIHNKTLQAEGNPGGALQAIPEEHMTKSVLEWTGPAVFTDSIFRFLKIESGINWPDLRNLVKPLRAGSITILPVTGFSPGVGNFGAQGRDSPQAMVEHKFGGSWKPKNRPGLLS